MGQIAEARLSSFNNVGTEKNFSRVPTSVAQGASPASVAFSSLVAQVLQRKESAQAKSFDELLADLTEEENDFTENPSREKFESYRKAVKALMDMLGKRSYRLHNWEDKRRRRYEIVKVIDAHLAALYSSLMRRNQDVVITLHLMGQIRGLIFDLQA
ncbi:MAG TPA: DUF327 family protein [Turneriella sp.]|nr:DUF327 family protein [Turneriella sp.]